MLKEFQDENQENKRGKVLSYCNKFQVLGEQQLLTCLMNREKKKRRPIKSSSHKSTVHRLNICLHAAYGNALEGGYYQLCESNIRSPVLKGHLYFSETPMYESFQDWRPDIRFTRLHSALVQQGKRELVKEPNWPSFCRCFLKPRFGVKGISLLKSFQE